MKCICLALIAICSASVSLAQHHDDSTRILKDLIDQDYIDQTEEAKGPAKVLHAEPLYIDLIRDLGARRGEKEWNAGFGITDHRHFDRYGALVEYEWAPVNRLGFEIELPFSFYYPTETGDAVPQSRLNSLKLATQFTCLVSEQLKTSLAIGYIHEFELTAFRNYKTTSLLSGQIFNPFAVAAKRWGQNFHTLVYTGPQILKHRFENDMHLSWQLNTSFHYMVQGTRNFIGMEINQEFRHGDYDVTLRPQMRLGLSEKMMVGIVAGIPANRESERFSTFIRLIYEPGHGKM